MWRFGQGGSNAGQDASTDRDIRPGLEGEPPTATRFSLQRQHMGGIDDVRAVDPQEGGGQLFFEAGEGDHVQDAAPVLVMQLHIIASGLNSADFIGADMTTTTRAATTITRSLLEIRIRSC